MIAIEGKWVTSGIEQKLLDAQNVPRMKDYTKSKFQWNDEIFNQVEWKSIKQGRRQCAKWENIKITKLMYDWVNTGHQKVIMEQVAECPCCGKEEETLEHMFQFISPQMKKVRG